MEKGHVCSKHNVTITTLNGRLICVLCAVEREIKMTRSIARKLGESPK